MTSGKKSHANVFIIAGASCTHIHIVHLCHVRCNSSIRHTVVISKSSLGILLLMNNQKEDGVFIVLRHSIHKNECYIQFRWILYIDEVRETPHIRSDEWAIMPFCLKPCFCFISKYLMYFNSKYHLCSFIPQIESRRSFVFIHLTESRRSFVFIHPTESRKSFVFIHPTESRRSFVFIHPTESRRSFVFIHPTESRRSFVFIHPTESRRSN